MISLYSWAKREKVSYSHAQKLLSDGEIEGAVRDGNRIHVPEESKAPVREMVTCHLCNSQFPQITGTHLRLHGTNIDEYRHRFPHAVTVAADISKKVSETNSGKILSQETKERISASKKGTPSWNAGLKGAYSPTAETRQRMSDAHMGLQHSEETKRKIGQAQVGKAISQESIAKQKLSAKKYLEENPGVFRGRTHTEETKLRIGEIVRNRRASETPEQKRELAAKISKAITGQKRTDEQKARYSAAIIKRIVDKPDSLRNTKGERQIEEWLINNNIHYKRQFVVEGVPYIFDFYLYDYNMIIEFDGAHHWSHQWFDRIVKSPEELDALLLARREKDAINNLLVGRAGYRIVRLFGKNSVGDTDDWPSFEEQLLLQI